MMVFELSRLHCTHPTDQLKLVCSKCKLGYGCDIYPIQDLHSAVGMSYTVPVVSYAGKSLKSGRDFLLM